MMVPIELNTAKAHLIASFFDQYLILNEEEEKQLEKEIKSLNRNEAMKVMELKTESRKGKEMLQFLSLIGLYNSIPQ
ncbi:hypothetical protein MXL46_10115 [Heyndrickxia sporothermodurans]|uniref:Uncharacterized protein n=1 Tax=Heyndrickxia sporothermodurans TaxID=46224 RepID=A0A150KKX4_9BACI|nr:hypothetical protein [Heyndrickxia sporothermodurans]KYC89950.1 hypothetical protein B4102_3957 [Heyndrickxia sporothermodurans]MBL5782252.1 hypothetical protein [Heyndrickxia sporothermodurans]MBL5794097.1 hypothetical protein [Heyndrickxia sporothermodurans]MBL5855109.1 hypothetical protein [Heyndrickxia sporothermodurans]MBL5866714.1 hypothetical protein [Heyndrickxia sporothermodurans]